MFSGLVRERVEGARLEYLAGYGPRWRSLWTDLLSHCPLFGLIYHHLLPEVVDTPDNRPLRMFACLALEHIFGSYYCAWADYVLLLLLRMSSLCLFLITEHEQSMFVSYYCAWAVYVLLLLLRMSSLCLFLITEHEQSMFCFLLLSMSSTCLALITEHEQSMFVSYYCAWAVYVWLFLLRMSSVCLDLVTAHERNMS